MEINEVGGGEGGGGDGIVVRSCGVRSGESLAEFFPLSWALQVRSIGWRRGAGVDEGCFFLGCAGRKVCWFGVRKGFGIDDIGSFSSEWRSASKSS